MKAELLKQIRKNYDYKFNLNKFTEISFISKDGLHTATLLKFSLSTPFSYSLGLIYDKWVSLLYDLEKVKVSTSSLKKMHNKRIARKNRKRFATNPSTK
jgi:hypothetical protein